MNDTLVIDLETKKSFAEVGGEKNIRDLGISVACAYSYAQDAFFAFEENELSKLEELIDQASCVIGFNIIHFDIPVMEPYMKGQSLARVSVIDLYADAVNFLGHRVGLGALAQATLGASKSGHGLEALEWFKEGRMEDIKKYCTDDVRLTRDLYEYGKAKGHVLFESRADGKIHSIPVQWGRKIEYSPHQSVEEAFAKRKRLMIEYVASQDGDGSVYRKERLIDIYAIKSGEIEAYCHLRKAVRNFRINRIVKAVITDEGYTLPADVQQALF